MYRFILPLLLLGFMACKDAPEQIPAYLHLKPFEVSAPGGAGWQKITDGWLYVNGIFLGAYTLPATVPVLAEGDSEVILFPGVKENGIEATPNIYPYLTRFVKNYTLTAGQTTDIQPITDYDSDNVYAFGIGRGDFDGGSFIALENRDTDGLLDFSLSTEGAFSGKSLLMKVDTAHPVMDIATEKIENLPVLGSPEVWLELHYKTDIPFYLYMLSGPAQESEPVYQFNVSEEWNKIYFNLTGTLVTTQQTEQRLYFRLSLPKDNSGGYSKNSGTVLIDNIRVVHF
jgi:hypothetical protein